MKTKRFFRRPVRPVKYHRTAPPMTLVDWVITLALAALIVTAVLVARTYLPSEFGGF